MKTPKFEPKEKLSEKGVHLKAVVKRTARKRTEGREKSGALSRPSTASEGRKLFPKMPR